jgi:hypothetical protein
MQAREYTFSKVWSLHVISYILFVLVLLIWCLFVVSLRLTDLIALPKRTGEPRSNGDGCSHNNAFTDSNNLVATTMESGVEQVIRRLFKRCQVQDTWFVYLQGWGRSLSRTMGKLKKGTLMLKLTSPASWKRQTS